MNFLRYAAVLAFLPPTIGWCQSPSVESAPTAADRPAPALRIENLRCEYLRNPLGIDVVRPRLSWVLHSPERGQRQIAYEVLVASSPESLSSGAGDLWRSGRVESDQSVQIEYAGKPLSSRRPCFWKVRVWDQRGRRSGWSDPANWTMGLLKTDDWQASWIAAKDWLDDQSWIWFPYPGRADQIPPGTCYFRAHLVLPNDADISQARVMMAADDEFALFINGELSLNSAEQHAFQYADIKARLKGGDNVFAVAATNKGNAPNVAGLVGKVTVILADGRELVLGTDPSWKVSDREETSWRDTAANDGRWRAARELGKYVKLMSGGRDTSWDKFSMNETSWLRKGFSLDSLPERAMAYINVKGYYELYVNGQKVGAEVLSPLVSSYRWRSYYSAYDIKPYLRQGKNCVGLWLGSGWYFPGYPGVKQSRPLARAQLELETGGKPLVVATDATWICHPSPYRLLGHWWYDEYGGECLDARHDMPEWCEPSLDEKQWTPALVVRDSPGRVSAPMCPANRIGTTIPAAACTDLGNGLYELDFGTCLTGWLPLRLPPMQSGRKVTITYAEKRFQSPNGDDTPAGHIATDSAQTFQAAGGPVCYQTYNQKDEFISAGKPNERFCSKFNYHVFQYAIVQGLPAKPAIGDAQALLVESDLDSAGSFSCSNSLLNRIYDVTLWSNRGWSVGGFFGEQGRERKGYGPIEVMLEPTIMTLGVPALYTKWAENWLDEQNPATGENLNTAPMNDPLCGGGPAWAATVTPLSWAMYLYYGDRRILERCYRPGQRYLDYLESNCKDDLLVRTGPFDQDWLFLGDWLPPDHGSDAKTEAGPQWPPPRVNAAFNNCYRVYLYRILQRTAEILGKTDDAHRYAARIAQLCRLVHQTYYDPKRHTYILDSQTYQALPLFAGTVPEADRDAVQRTLEQNILVRRREHIDVGSLGSWFLIQYLQRIGRNDLMYTVVNQKTYPGWGYMVERGASTLWEQWNGYVAQSCNCYPAIGSWFQQGLAGILPDPSSPGFRKIVIKPAVVGDLTWVKAHYDSIHGRIRSDWNREGRKLTMNVTIPPNTTASVYVPAKNATQVLESGRPVAELEAVKFLRTEHAAAVYEIGSGTYQFVSELPGR
jgi:alpha-L-rhamnosidase